MPACESLSWRNRRILLEANQPCMPSKGHLLRILGVGFGVAVSLGGTVGAGILRTPGAVAAQLRSAPLIMLAWIAGGVYALVCTISVSELGTMLPFEGGWYVYASRAFGGYGGFFAGYSDWLVEVVSLSYVATAAGEFIAALVPRLSSDIKTIAIFVLTVLGLLHYMGIRIGSRAQRLNSLVVGLGLVGFVVACFAVGHRDLPRYAPTMIHLSPTGLPLVIAFVIAFQSIIITYDGWYSAIYFMEEDRDPTRNLPRSALGGVACSIGIFLLVNIALLYVLPLPQLAASEVPAADAAQFIFGKAGQQIILLIALLTVFGVINATLLMAPRILFALGRDGLFLRRAAEVNDGGTPTAGLLLTVLTAIGLILGRSFEKLVSIQSVLAVVLYLTGFISLFVLRRREPNLPRPFPAWGYPWTPLTALIGSLVYLALNIGSDFKNGLLALTFVALSYPAFLLAVRLRAR
jgi:basic amino acid/polyamine antiporter, APA family